MLRTCDPPALAAILAWPLVAPSYLTARIGLRFAEAREAARAAGGHAAFPAIVLEPVGVGLAIATTSDVVAPATAPVAAPLLRGGALVALRWHEPWLVTNIAVLALRGRPLSSPATAMLEAMAAADTEAFALAGELLPDLLGAIPRAHAEPGRRAKDR